MGRDLLILGEIGQRSRSGKNGENRSPPMLWNSKTAITLLCSMYWYFVIVAVLWIFSHQHNILWMFMLHQQLHLSVFETIKVRRMTRQHGAIKYCCEGSVNVWDNIIPKIFLTMSLHQIELTNCLQYYFCRRIQQKLISSLLWGHAFENMHAYIIAFSGHTVRYIYWIYIIWSHAYIRLLYSLWWSQSMSKYTQT